MAGKEKTGRKIRFNILDVAVAVLLLGAIAGIMIRYSVVDRIGATSQKEEARITFVAAELRDSTTEAFVKGDVFYWKQNGMRVGTLESKDRNYSEVMIRNSDFEMVKAVNDSRYDVTGVIRASGIFTDDGFMLDGTQYIGPGKEMILQSKNITVTVTITEVSKAASGE